MGKPRQAGRRLARPSFQVRADLDLIDAATRAAEARHQSLSDFVRQAVVDKLAELDALPAQARTPRRQGKGK